MIVYDENKQLYLTVKLADTFIGRLKGLMFKTQLADGQGILLSPCSSIHTCFMRFPIDVIYISEKHEVLGCETIEPWRVGKRIPGTKMVVETTAGNCKQLRIGTYLFLDNAPMTTTTGIGD